MKTRVKNCFRLLAKRNCDSLLLSNPVNVAYLTGSEEMFGYLLVTHGEKPIFFTNFLYQTTAKRLTNCKVVVSKQKDNTFGLIAEEAQRLKIRQFGFEADNLKVRQQDKLKTLLLNKKINCVATDNLVEGLRAIKEPKEISLIKKSIQISQEAFQFAAEIFSSSMSEKALTIEIERFLRLKGDNQVAFRTIVASGKNSAFPHHCSNETKIGSKSFLIDLGSKYYGYCADLTRVFFWGKMPLLFRKIYDTVREARAQAIAKIKDGVRACDVDYAARKIIDKKGWGKYFGHGLGHGIGMAVHEEPRIGPKNTDILKEGMVVTVEPGVYLENRFGIRIEDMILVKKNRAELLSRYGNR